MEGMGAGARKHNDLLGGLEGLEADCALIAFGDEFLRGLDGGRKYDFGLGLHAEVEEHEYDEERNDHDEQNKGINLRPDHNLSDQNDIQQTYLCLRKIHLHSDGESRCQNYRREELESTTYELVAI